MVRSPFGIRPHKGSTQLGNVPAAGGVPGISGLNTSLSILYPVYSFSFLSCQ